MRRATLYLLFHYLPSLVAKRCGQAAKSGDSAAKTVRVETAKAVKHTFSGRLPITGELKAGAGSRASSRKWAATVVVLNFDEGDLVKKAI